MNTNNTVEYQKHKDIIPGLPIMSIADEKRFNEYIKMLYPNRIRLMLTGSNCKKSGYFIDTQIECINLIMTKIRNSEVLSNKTVLIGSSAHARAPMGRFDVALKYLGHVLDNYIQEAGYKYASSNTSDTNQGPPMLIFKFDKNYRGTKYNFNITINDIYIGNYYENDEGTIYKKTDESIEDKDATFLIKPLDEFTIYKDQPVLEVQTPGTKLFDDNIEPPEWQGIKAMTDNVLLCGGMLRASQIGTKRDGGSCKTMDIPKNTEYILNNKPHNDNALFVFGCGGYSILELKKKLSPEQLENYKPKSVSLDIWNTIVSADLSNLEEYTNNIISALEQIVLEQIVYQ